jgi:hypothetical protein
MSGYRTHDGQHSDRMPIKRTTDEKKRMLVQLKEQQAGLKAWTSPEVKTALSRRIAELEQDIGGPRRG